VPIGCCRPLTRREVAVVALASLSACRATRVGATDADLARGHERAAKGATSYSTECAGCHGRRGEGRAGAPAILGLAALPEFPHNDSVASGFSFQDPQELQIQQQTRSIRPPMRGPFRTAHDLYDYMTVHVADERIHTWRPDDSWAVVTFMMAAHGCRVPQEGIHADNAPSVPMQGCQ
jgi:hypothetical protein